MGHTSHQVLDGHSFYPAFLINEVRGFDIVDHDSTVFGCFLDYLDGEPRIIGAVFIVEGTAFKDFGIKERFPLQRLLKG